MKFQIALNFAACVVSIAAEAGPMSGGGGLLYFQPMAACTGQTHDGQAVTAGMNAVLRVDNFEASVKIAEDETSSFTCASPEPKTVRCESEGGTVFILKNIAGGVQGQLLSRGESIALKCQIPEEDINY